MISRRLAALAGLLALLAPQMAAAHITQTGSGGFTAGFEHPLSGYDHFLAMFSVGLWGAQMGGRRVWSLPVTFPMIMVVGGVIGILGLPLPGIEIGIALSIIVLGLAIAAAWKPAEWVSLAIIAVFALYHGYAHGAELPMAADPADFAIGFVLATGMIHVIGVGVGLVLEPIRHGQFSKLLGVLIAVVGLGFLALALGYLQSQLGFLQGGLYLFGK
ncbi:MAG: HupE/UreJ family protein [Thioclava marina]|jgi:Hydrogenase/urease accessory protein|uniref:Urease accessory protein n=1 Tax=Thioclava marina TaxID=1915077 RepID=A0ABX3MPH1_9RHOB|nr:MULTISPECIES: HupE/UreJ family protein [Thioclava]TNE94406.1 MAG: HupE/UreJ family protein [Paracoccaceae bacterium]MBC7145613.1 HupE/UreJ family protein [Thioclava marina]MBD3804777.1 HupE/UreJ family protein [Thioclava sp.]OOY12109.1 urease accessory protein [Thioclava marina]OOY27702.1 urease accessory protein [Thioclava sp. L04-15]